MIAIALATHPMILMLIVHMMLLTPMVLTLEGLMHIHLLVVVARTVENVLVSAIVMVVHPVVVVCRRMRARRPIWGGCVGVWVEQTPTMADGRAVAVVRVTMLLRVGVDLAAGLKPGETIGHHQPRATSLELQTRT